MKPPPSYRKILSAFLLFILFMAGIASCSPAPVSNNQTAPVAITRIRVVMDNNYPPYAFENEKGEMQGIVIDQWEAWEKHTGIEVEIIGLRWDEALKWMKLGEYDVIDTIFYTEERARFFDFTEPYADIETRIFFPENVSGIANVDSLQGFRVAVKAGDANADYLFEQGVANLIYYESYEAIIQAAAEKKESIFVIDQPPALYFLYKYGIQDQFKYSQPLNGGKFHRAVYKGNTATLALVERGFADISEEEYQQINERWLGKNQSNYLKEWIAYAGIGASAAALLIAILVFFNRELQARVKMRTEDLEKTMGELKESEARFRKALEFLPIPIGIADDKGNILEYNHNFIEKYGYTPQDTLTIAEWLQRAYPDPAYRKESSARWNRDVEKSIAENTATPKREYRIVDKGGSPHDVEIVAHAVGNLWITAFHDITERKRAEASLQKSERRLRKFIEQTADGIIFVDHDGLVIEWNKACEKISGLSKEQALGMHILDIQMQFTPEDEKKDTDIEAVKQRQNLFFELGKFPEGKKIFEEVKIVHRDGALHTVEQTLFPIETDDGFALGVVLHNITARKQAEEAIKEAEMRYRALVENAPAVIYLDNIDKTNSTVYISKQVETLLGYSPDDFSRQPNLWYDLLHPEDRERALITVERVQRNIAAAVEYRMIRSDGKIIWVRDTSAPIRDEEGKPIFVQGFLQDITDQKKLEASLLESEERYRTLFDDSPIPLMEEDFSELKQYIDRLKKDGVKDLRAYFQENPNAARECTQRVRIIDVNKAAVNWYQAKHKHEIQVRLSEIISQEGHATFIEEILLLDQNRHYEIPISRMDYQHNPLHIIIRGTVVPNYEETWGRVLIIIMDITSLKRTEEELARQLELLRGLRAIDHAIITNSDLSVNLDIIIHEVVKQLQVDAASISLLQGEMLTFASGYGFKTDPRLFTQVNDSSGLTKRVTRENHHIHIRNLQEVDYPGEAARAIQQEGFVAYYGVPLIAQEKMLGILEIFHRTELDNAPSWLTFLETLAGQAAITISNATLFNDLQISTADLQKAYDTTLEGWSRALDLRDKETEGHTRRVTELTLKLARQFHIDEEQLIHIWRGSLLHDIGKMGIPDAILHKPAALTEDEWRIMRKHPQYAYEMLAPISYLQPALDIPYYHHEQWDGQGYPHGLKGEQIPLVARIFSIVDAWDALASNRPYRAAWSDEKIKAYLREMSGKKFDPRVVEVFLQMMDNRQ